MNLWNKIVLGSKFIFGGFESATDYLCKLFNSFITKDNVAGKIKSAREFVLSVLSYMKKYEKYCPAIWANDYLKLQEAIQTFADVFEDGKVTAEEIEKAIDSVKSAINEWMK